MKFQRTILKLDKGYYTRVDGERTVSNLLKLLSKGDGAFEIMDTSLEFLHKNKKIQRLFDIA